MVEVDGGTLPVLRQFNIPQSKINEFIESMNSKWGADNSAFISAQVNARLTLPSDLFTTHLAQFYSSVDVNGLITQRKAEIAQAAAPVSIVQAASFFGVEAMGEVADDEDVLRMSLLGTEP